MKNGHIDGFNAEDSRSNHVKNELFVNVVTTKFIIYVVIVISKHVVIIVVNWFTADKRKTQKKM